MSDFATSRRGSEPMDEEGYGSQKVASVETYEEVGGDPVRLNETVWTRLEPWW